MKLFTVALSMILLPMAQVLASESAKFINYNNSSLHQMESLNRLLKTPHQVGRDQQESLHLKSVELEKKLNRMGIDGIQALGINGVGNGGDASEATFHSIRRDLLAWIIDGRDLERLSLPSHITQDQYQLHMYQAMKNHVALVSFTEEELSIQGVSKTCVNFVVDKDLHIKCNIDRFNETPLVKKYELIHHEFAASLGFEKNEGPSSDYSISEQVVQFLKPTDQMRLTPLGSLSPHFDDIEISCGYKLGWFKLKYDGFELNLEVTDYSRTYQDGRTRGEVLGQQRDINTKNVGLNVISLKPLLNGVTVVLDVKGNPTLTVQKKSNGLIVISSNDKDIEEIVTGTLGLEGSTYSCLYGR